MAIGSIGSSAQSNLTQTNHTALRQRTAASLVKDMDTDQSGSVSKDEFVAFGEALKANGPQGAAPQGARAPTLPSADAMFSATDTNGDNSLSVDELSSMMAQAETQRAASSAMQDGTRGAGKAGPPPGGGGPRPGGAMAGVKGSAGASGSDESSSSSKTTEAADTNKDGTVSAAEKLIYELTHPTASSEGSTS